MEDHPKWKKWSDAYDALVKAAEDLRNNSRLPPSDPVYEAAVRRHKAAPGGERRRATRQDRVAIEGPKIAPAWHIIVKAMPAAA